MGHGLIAKSIIFVDLSTMFLSGYFTRETIRPNTNNSIWLQVNWSISNAVVSKPFIPGTLYLHSPERRLEEATPSTTSWNHSRKRSDRGRSMYLWSQAHHEHIDCSCLSSFSTFFLTSCGGGINSFFSTFTLTLTLLNNLTTHEQTLPVLPLYKSQNFKKKKK